MANAGEVDPVPARVAGSDRVALRDPVFISDLHLCAQRPRTLRRFLDLLEAIGGSAAELVILGDLFEYWAGDDALQDGGPDDLVGVEVAQALRRLGSRNTIVYLMHGNRDVLLGTQFLQASGARLLADPAIARIGVAPTQQPTLLAHGDAYCTLDLPYQAFRSQAREPSFQAAFLARPLAERRALIGQARARSETGKQQMSAEIMDVTPAAIAEALRSAGVRQMIHGHTHRPARHDFPLDEVPAIRWVLPDWDQDTLPPRGGGLRLVAGVLQDLRL